LKSSMLSHLLNMFNLMFGPVQTTGKVNAMHFVL